MDIKIIFNGYEQQVFIQQKPVFLTDSNTALITLDASAQSLLNWKEQEDLAVRCVAEGFYLLWELDFAIEKEFVDQTHFMTLQLAVDHFNQTIWPKFTTSSLGVLVYRGEISSVYPLLDSLKSLAAALPDEALHFLQIETSTIKNEAHYIQMVRQDLFGHFIPLLSGIWPQKYPYAIPALAWGHSCSPLGAFNIEKAQPLPQQRIFQAFCLSEEEESELLPVLVGLKNPFRVLPEKILTQEWDGIDEIFAFSQRLSFQGKRKLAGFSAAGGKISWIIH